jgi:hypothetical protein
LFDNLRQSNEQAIRVDRLVVEDMKSDQLHIEHQKQLEDKSPEVNRMFGMWLGTVYDMYHQDTCQNLLDMFHEWGKEQSYWRYIHHLDIEVSPQDNLWHWRTYQEPKHKCHQSISPPYLDN